MATHLKDLELIHESDSDIFAAAAAGDRIAVVTKDADLPKLLQQRGPPPVVLWVRTGTVTNRELRRIVLEAWPRALDLFANAESLVEIRRHTGVAT